MCKKKWITPLITVLMRGKSEERVLSICKGSPYQQVGPVSAYAYCGGGTYLGNCGIACGAWSAS